MKVKKIKKAVPILLAILMLAQIFTTWTLDASSDCTVLQGFIAEIEPPAEYSIAISTRAELEAIKNNFSGTYHLTADIDLSGEDWVPIGDGSNRFTGTLDGQGYVIRNLTIGTEETPANVQYAGLFGYIFGAIIKNVGLEDTYINTKFSSASVDAGGICGIGYGKTTINNCYNTGDVSASSSHASAGGICGGSCIYVTISNCNNTGDVSASAATSAYAGGICGEISVFYFDSFTISNCYNTGDVSAYSATAFANAGGICGSGYIYTTSSVIISNCYNTGNVSASSSVSSANAGGICASGYIYTTSSVAITISNCYNTGDVSDSALQSLPPKPEKKVEIIKDAAEFLTALETAKNGEVAEIIIDADISLLTDTEITIPSGVSLVVNQEYTLTVSSALICEDELIVNGNIVINESTVVKGRMIIGEKK